MFKLLIESKNGIQEIVTNVPWAYQPDNGFVVLWDERKDGPLPSIELGSMKRVGNTLVIDPATKARHDSAVARKEEIKTLLAGAGQANTLPGIAASLAALIESLKDKGVI